MSLILLHLTKKCCVFPCQCCWIKKTTLTAAEFEPTTTYTIFGFWCEARTHSSGLCRNNKKSRNIVILILILNIDRLLAQLNNMENA